MPKPIPFDGYSHDVIFIDAIPGSGKSLLGPIVASFENVERQTMGLFTIEHLIAATYLDICDINLAQQIIQQIVAVNHYNMHIGRNINMKFDDISGPFSNPHRLKYFLRLFTGSSGTDKDISLLNDFNIAPLIKIHGCIYNLALLRSAFSSRLKFIELVRHPLDTINSWINAQNYYRNGKRGFSLRLDDNHIIFDYLGDLNTPDCSPLRQYNFLFSNIRKNFENNSSDFLLIPFEYFLCNSRICINLLKRFLARQPISNQLRRSLSQQKCNRYSFEPSNSAINKYQLHKGEPLFITNARKEAFESLLLDYSRVDVDNFLEHVEWYNQFFIGLSSLHY